MDCAADIGGCSMVEVNRVESDMNLILDIVSLFLFCNQVFFLTYYFLICYGKNKYDPNLELQFKKISLSTFP